MAGQVLPITLGTIQWSPELYAASLVLLLWSLHRNAQGLVLAADSA